MKGNPEERAITLARYIIETGCTVRGAAQTFCISKSTVHKDVTCRLRHLNPGLYQETKTILEKNKAERHLRGGAATRQKYAEKH
ncbi:MAG: sporulation transcriptional regulator SpoIIID [Candidatus Fournierella pullistercoris]|uniref:Sporulation transcriptional regulator SpoIIID n=1 Tax=Candidatus Allofournierella pullistercoris TaxID=2838597 RepID=A0A948SZV8_9FIRM|nr:sporulation transcriptional regulator SpoIIID [Candidatus Fournierella pullistercoris]